MQKTWKRRLLLTQDRGIPSLYLFSLKYERIKQISACMFTDFDFDNDPANGFIVYLNALLTAAYCLFYRFSYLSLHTMNTWVLRYIF